MSEKNRDLLRPIIEQNAIAWAVAQLDASEIDQINILNASIAAMHKAIKALLVQPNFLLIDGNRFKPYPNIPHQCIVKGDSKFLAIAAASVLAKTHRDEYMQQLDAQYPQYNWQHNKGYPTAAHRAAIVQHGITPYHRLSYRLLPNPTLNFDVL